MPCDTTKTITLLQLAFCRRRRSHTADGGDPPKLCVRMGTMHPIIMTRKPIPPNTMSTITAVCQVPAALVAICSAVGATYVESVVEEDEESVVPVVVVVLPSQTLL
mmetsp:Transcript_54308/g.146446  ORF Transcript_54308/g.146446 Transcript_54308/m.146446 type:complete len:106 (-) Transcript_54308:107-424(-)